MDLIFQDVIQASFNAWSCFSLIWRQWTRNLPWYWRGRESRVKFLGAYIKVDKYRKYTGNQEVFVLRHMAGETEHLPNMGSACAMANPFFELVSINVLNYFHCINQQQLKVMQKQKRSQIWHHNQKYYVNLFLYLACMIFAELELNLF